MNDEYINLAIKCGSDGELAEVTPKSYEGIRLRYLNDLGASALDDIIAGLEMAEPNHPALVHLRAARQAFSGHPEAMVK